MAQSVIFEGTTIKIPGAYSAIKFNLQNPPINLSFGGLTIVDTGQNYNYGFGSGVTGVLRTGKKSVYNFDSIEDFQDAVGGGILWLLAEYLFFPAGRGSGLNGISNLEIVKAANTVPAESTFAPVGGGGNGGTIVLQANTEGKPGNGVNGDEVASTGTIQVTAAGASADTISADVDGDIIGVFANTGSDTVDQMATGLAASINLQSKDTGYVATVSTDTVTITAIRGVGAAGDTPVLTAIVTGTATATVVTFAGGVDGSILTVGFAFTLEAGLVDPTKFIFKLWRGGYKGDDADINLDITESLDFVAELLSDEVLLAESIEVSTINELVAWMNTNANFKFWFTLKSNVSTGDGSIDAADLVTFTPFILFAGGTDTYNITELQNALGALRNSQSSFILCQEFGTSNAQSVNNVTIEGFAVANPSDLSSAKYKKQMYVAGGDDNDEFANSVSIANFYNTDVTSIVHGGIEKIKSDGVRKKYKAITQAAYLLGREAGIEPQNPLTNKNINIDGLIHDLTEKQKIEAIDSGVLVTIFDEDFEDFVCMIGVNSLQDNENLVNGKNQSYSKQLNRIVNQINKELPIAAKIALFGKEEGANRNTVTQEDVQTFTLGFLGAQTSTDLDDDLLLTFQNVVVKTDGVAYRITYEVIPNFEVNFLLFTGTVVDPTL